MSTTLVRSPLCRLIIVKTAEELYPTVRRLCYRLWTIIARVLVRESKRLTREGDEIGKCFHFHCKHFPMPIDH